MVEIWRWSFSVSECRELGTRQQFCVLFREPVPSTSQYILTSWRLMRLSMRYHQYMYCCGDRVRRMPSNCTNLRSNGNVRMADIIGRSRGRVHEVSSADLELHCISSVPWYKFRPSLRNVASKSNLSYPQICAQEVGWPLMVVRQQYR